MARTTVGAENDKPKTIQKTRDLLNTELTNATAFNNLTNAAKFDLIRRALVLLLRVAKRSMERG